MTSHVGSPSDGLMARDISELVIATNSTQMTSTKSDAEPWTTKS